MYDQHIPKISLSARKPDMFIILYHIVFRVSYTLVTNLRFYLVDVV